jgi:predicted ATPase
MKDSYNILVSNRHIKYNLTVRRNITIIQGDSATGKTTLVKMINDYYNEGEASGVKLSCTKQCVVLHGKNWQNSLELINDSIVFIDEGNKFIKSKDFAKAIKKSDNYYVIITRENLTELPYSVNEIEVIKNFECGN